LPAAFDPYQQWLGVPPEEQPPNHYRLLGIALFEQDRAVIERAAQQRSIHLRALAGSGQVPLVEKLIAEVAAAKACLLAVEKKASYDHNLRLILKARAVTTKPPPPPTSQAPTAVVSSTSVPALPAAVPLTAPPGRALGATRDVSQQPTDIWSGIAQLGEYKLLEKLGEGGMGAVYKAMHTKLGRVVALKILSRERVWDDRVVARFEREMRAAGAVDHPNVVRATDAREVDGIRLLAMEFVDGLDLAALVRRCHPLPVADVCELVRQAALGLQAAHEHGLVHRDVKPSNLMVSRQGHVKLLDLGLARFALDQPLESEVTSSDQTVGTVEYMAPEQFSDSHAVDIRADIYSLGCTCFKLLTARTPFVSGEQKGLVQRILAQMEQPLPSIHLFRGDVPKELCQVLERMLAKDPAARPATPAVVAELMAPFAVGNNLPVLCARAVKSPEHGPGGSTAVTATQVAAAPPSRRWQRVLGPIQRIVRSSSDKPWVQAWVAVTMAFFIVAVLVLASLGVWTLLAGHR
jgi:serine/threonine protein kinase